MTNNMTTQQISTQILNQLGGSKFIAMTGSLCYYDRNTFISKFKGSKKANIMYITLNENDTYDVKICKYQNLNIKEVNVVNGAYAEMLKPLFEKTTGLFLSI